MIIAASNFIDLLPNFLSESHKLHNLLLVVPFLLFVVGIYLCAYQTHRTQSIDPVKPQLLRLGIIILIIVAAPGFGDLLNDMVRDLVSQMGINSSGGNPGNAFEAYRSAIAKKWGTDSISQGQQQVHNSAAGQQPITNPGGSTTTHFTHYGYDGDPDGDHRSGNYPGQFTGHGIGNHDNPLVAGQSLAISQDLVQQYGLQLGETVSLTTPGGQTVTGVYADTPGNDVNGQPLNGIVDIYDPQNQYANLSGQGISGINGLGVQNTSAGTGLLGMVQNATEAAFVAVAGPFIYILSVVAAGIMWFMTGVQQVLYVLEIAVSPIFLGMLAVPALAPIGTRFMMSLVGLCCWPIGWAVWDLVVKALIDLMTNPTRNVGMGMANVAGVQLGIWALLAVVIILGSFLVPMMVNKAIMSGSSGFSQLIASSLSTMTRLPNQATQMYRASILAGNAGRAIGNGSSTFSSSLNGNRTNQGFRPNYAKRPPLTAP